MLKRLLVLVIFLLSYTQAIGQSVDTAWVRRYECPGNGTDWASAIAVDGSGSVYVTGSSTGSGTSYDYATIKYYSNGDTAWVRRYNGPGNRDDDAIAIAADDSGNVYVTGSSAGSGTYYDYATIKYYSNGDTAWVRRYDGPANGVDVAYAIVVDSFGGVYVSGLSTGSGTYYDYATIKYYSNGDTAWARRYNGPGNGNDAASATAVDGSGNVYVTGTSYDSVSATDYATIKYHSNGDTAWVRRYNGPGNLDDWALAMAVDSSGSVYVTGYSWNGTDYDYATIKYYSNGDTAWLRRYNGPGDGEDRARAIAVDSSGSVYVTGRSEGSGTWYDYATIKYCPNGDTAWVRRYSGPGNDGAFAIAVDGSGSVYVTGFSSGSGADDYATIKYYSNGDTAWVKTYNGLANNDDEAFAIAVDPSGSIYVTGYSKGSGASDYTTIKYIQFLRGDANHDKKVTIADIVFLVSYLFKGGPPPNPIQSGDANCDGKVTIADIVYLVSYLFKFGPTPCQ